MSNYDKVYNELIGEVLTNGVFTPSTRAKYSDGKAAHTYELLNKQLKFDNKETLILTNKFVAWKRAIQELVIWMWQWKSNDVNELRNINGTDKTVWSEWEQEDGTIGLAYGYQLGRKCRYVVDPEDKGVFLGRQYKLDQVDYVIHMLKNNPSSRRIKTNIWIPEDLDEMALEPCFYETHWQVQNDQLHLTVNARSNDLALGNPFNVFQYQTLQKVIAQCTGWEVGTLTFNIDNIHIYDRHIEGLMKQMSNNQYPAPELWINPEKKHFYDFTIEDFKLIGYEYEEKITFPVAE